MASPAKPWLKGHNVVVVHEDEKTHEFKDVDTFYEGDELVLYKASGIVEVARFKRENVKRLIHRWG